uniref:Reverse transcriptase domain-containing protein n=1 Tax=Oreochromis niloticus TaxID=8128 RepID=A0A669BP42_ORENI
MSKIKREGIEVAFLQESHLSKFEHEKLKKWKFNQYSSSCLQSSKRGVVILISRRLNFECVQEIGDKEGRFVLVKGYLEGTLTTLINVYAPPGSELKFFKQVFEMIVVEAQGTLILGGDWNVRLNPSLDSSNPHAPGLNKITKNIKLILKDLGLIDVWRELNPIKKDYTFFSHPHSFYSRLDYFFMFQKDFNSVVNCRIGVMDLSDHAPLYLEVVLGHERRATSWKLNTSTLCPLKEQISQDIIDYVAENDNEEVSPSILWDALKAVIRGKLIGYSTNLKKKRNEHIRKLQTQLQYLEDAHKIRADINLKLEIQKKKNEIDEIFSSEIQKNMAFLQQRYYEVGGKSAKLLAYKLKKQQSENTIYKIKDPQTNNIVYKLEDIQLAFLKFYKELYTQPRVDVTGMISFLDSLCLPKLNENQNITLIKDISEIEIKKAISKLKPNKSPGPDGFPSDWYKEMKELLIPLMRTSFNYILKTGVIPPSWNEASISLIAKEGKDRLDCGNYRPISVLNQDYKIFTYILAKRIENILAQIISLDQTGFIKQRQTQDNVRRTLHVIDYVGKNKIPMVLMSLDAEKAFDRVNWEFLYKVMGKFGFHQSFIRIIQALYKSPRARIKVNGALSNVFNLQRGTRQGCPLSPSLFALFIEALSQSVIQRNNITGVKIMGREHKISLFADDILIYLTNPNITFPKLLSLLETFGSLSGYKLNILKTQILTFNYKPNQEIKSKVNLNWESEWMKYLGVNITKDLSKLYNANFNPLCYKIPTALLTLGGAVTWCSLALWYSITSCSCSNSRVSPVCSNTVCF